LEEGLFLVDHLGRLDVSTLPLFQRAAIRFVQFSIGVWEQFRRDTIVIRASGLAYSSLLATVPLIAVIFSVLAAFGALDDLQVKVQEFLLSNFLPTQHDEITGMLDQFTSNTAKLGFLGFVFLSVAAILLLDSIENNFNDIYHVTSRRRIIAKITAYTAVLVFGTLFIGASLSISARIQAMLMGGGMVDLSWVTRQLSWLFPLVLAFLAFLLLYQVVPYTRVRFKSALLGAAIAAVFFEVAKHLFADWVGQSVRYSTIYGSLAVVPIFLIWLYVTWIVVLLGLEIAFTHQHFLTLLRSRAVRGGPEGDRAGMGLRLFTLVAQRFDAGGDPPTLDQLSRRLLVPMEVAEKRIRRLVEVGLIRRVILGSDGEGIVPARPPDQVLVCEVIEAFQPQMMDPGPNRCVEETVNELMAEFLDAGHRRVADLSFGDVLQRVAARED
jgi:membrane protein